MLLRLFMAARPQFITASIVPVLVATAYVKWRDGVMDPRLSLLTLLGMALLHAAGNLLNDFFDHLTGADEANVQFVSPFSGGARAIQRGLVRARHVLLLGLLFLAAGCAIGVYLAATRGLAVLGIGLVGVVTLFFYTAPPLRLSYAGFGELIIALDFGILPMLGTEYVLVRQCSDAMLLLGLSIACMIVAVLWVNQFPDADSDALVGKRHLVVILGRPLAAAVLTWVYVIGFGMVALMVARLWLPADALCAMIAIIPAGVAMQRLNNRPDDRLAWQEACPAAVIAQLAFGLLLFTALLLAAPPVTPVSP